MSLLLFMKKIVYPCSSSLKCVQAEVGTLMPVYIFSTILIVVQPDSTSSLRSVCICSPWTQYSIAWWLRLLEALNDKLANDIVLCHYTLKLLWRFSCSEASVMGLSSPDSPSSGKARVHWADFCPVCPFLLVVKSKRVFPLFLYATLHWLYQSLDVSKPFRKLNEDKTEILLFVSRFKTHPPFGPVQILQASVLTSDSARNIGVILDSKLTGEQQTTKKSVTSIN